ncbi:hypothetical protein L210DRAFT_961538 [Boletus edulis BED1]|uniref:Uncharacterized protein n=1 Tax=Boletus edulis BED1 TaxID=1328754 RepID=A0AAD4G8E8_BOLED|nr:hypothetical protein L210DRAFT_961538 [Boletus edulis BED1]
MMFSSSLKEQMLLVADDACHLKLAVVTWLTDANPRLIAHDKTGRGLYNDATARLICPVEFDWDKAEYFLITAHSWPHFLYKDGRYDPANPAEGLFQGILLVKAVKLTFTSPSSVDEEDRVVPPGQGKRCRGERRTRTHIAGLLGMKKVAPRAITYVAVQLRPWRLVYGLFDHTKFYDNIVSWFEDTRDVEEKKFVDELLLWWNK